MISACNALYSCVTYCLHMFPMRVSLVGSTVTTYVCLLYPFLLYVSSCCFFILVYYTMFISDL